MSGLTSTVNLGDDKSKSSANTFEPYEINGYLLSREFESAGAGTAEWSVCQQYQKEFFIKRFLSPKFIEKDGSSNINEVRRAEKICNDWFRDKQKVQSAVLRANRGNLVVPINLFRYGNNFYLITEMIHKNDVTIEKMKYQTYEQRQIVMKVLAREIMYLSQQHVVHGDLKPENIMLQETIKGYFTAKIIDFDNSFLESDVPSPELLGGDQRYWSPEAIWYMTMETGTVTAKADVFALGLIFHQILTGGAFPDVIDKDEDYYTGEAVLNGGKIKMHGQLGERLERLIRAMLCQDPKKRISAKETFEYLVAMDNPMQVPRLPHDMQYYMPEDPEIVFGGETIHSSSIGNRSNPEPIDTFDTVGDSFGEVGFSSESEEKDDDFDVVDFEV